MAAQPDISQILAALGASQRASGTPQTSSTPQPNHSPYPGVLQGQPPSAPPSYLPQPSNTGSVDLSSIKPVSSGSVSITDAINKARTIAAERGLGHEYRPSSVNPRDDPRMGGRGGQRSRSRSRSPARRDGYSGNPYRDERREDSRRNSYRRSPSPDRNFRGARDPPMGNRLADSDTDTIRVKSSLVGLIIGRNGENLRKVEQETGARVQFIQAKDSHTPERQCTISGPARARERAKDAIFTIIEENGGSASQEKGAYSANMPGRAKVNLPALREGESSTQIMVPDRTVGLIIGRGGETIKDLQERSKCHVNIVGENKSVNGYRPVNLIGDERSTAMAKQLILEIVESDSRGQGSNAVSSMRDRGFGSGGGNVSGNNAIAMAMAGGAGMTMGGGGRDNVDKTIRVPSEAVGMIIGKGGEAIKDMQRTTGCKINVNQPKPPDVHRNIDLSGTSRSVEDAERIIWEKVETVRQRDAAGGRNQGGQDHGASQMDAYSQAQQQPAIPGYGQYFGAGAPAAQAAPQMPMFQMPQAAPQQSQQPGGQQQADQSAQDQYAQWYAQWYMQQVQQQQQQQQQHGAAPGTQ